MKKLLIALSVISLSVTSACAQTTTTIRTTTVKTIVPADTTNYAKNYKVCKGSKTYYTCGKKPSVAKKTTIIKEPQTTVATKSDNDKNFAVCKGKGDYHICAQQPNTRNSVKTRTTKTRHTINKTQTVVTPNGVIATYSTKTYATQPVKAPQSQSLNGAPTNRYIPHTDSLADTINNATAPYNGEKSPQYDGPAKNKQRNINTVPQSPNATFK